MVTADLSNNVIVLGDGGGTGRSGLRNPGDPSQAGWTMRRAQPAKTALPVNVGNQERAVSLAAGSILALLGLSRRGLPGLVIAGVGGGLLFRGATGYCSMYKMLDIDTAADGNTGTHVNESCLINRTPEELYTFWRNFSNLPKAMSYLHSVEVTGDKTSHWVADAPAIVGGSVAWDAEITRDEPNSRIDWRSIPGSVVPNSGSVEFTKARGDRGTAVRVTIDYAPPGGSAGKWAAKLLGNDPEKQIKEGLRHFKRLMETGEVISTEGQPRGTCTGAGKRENA